MEGNHIAPCVALGTIFAIRITAFTFLKLYIFEVFLGASSGSYTLRPIEHVVVFTAIASTGSHDARVAAAGAGNALVLVRHKARQASILARLSLQEKKNIFLNFFARFAFTVSRASAVSTGGLASSAVSIFVGVGTRRTFIEALIPVQEWVFTRAVTREALAETSAARTRAVALFTCLLRR